MSEKNQAALEMLNRALEMEQKGKAFYDKAVKSCRNELGREIFKSLAADEVVHEERIKAIYKTLQENKGWNDEWTKWEPTHRDMNTFFKDLAAKHRSEMRADTGDIEALEIGIDFELKAVKYYGEHLKRADDPLEKAFLERMIREEKSHHGLLADTKLYLSSS